AQSGNIQAGFGDDLRPDVDVFRADVEVRRNPQDVVVTPALAHQQAPVLGGVHQRGGEVGIRRVIHRVDDLHTLHQPHAAHIANELELRLQFFQLGTQAATLHGGVLRQVVFLDI